MLVEQKKAIAIAAKRLRTAEVVEAGRMAVPWFILRTTNLTVGGRLSQTQEKIRASRTEPIYIGAHSQTAAIFKIAGRTGRRDSVGS